VSSYNITEELNIDHKTVFEHLHKAEHIKKLDIWVPHYLLKHLIDQISTCEFPLLKRNKIEPYLIRLNNEKWIT